MIVSNLYKFKKAISTILQIYAKKLFKNFDDKKISKIIIQKNWADLKIMTNENIRDFLTLLSIFVNDLKQLNHTLLNVHAIIAILFLFSQIHVRKIEKKTPKKW